MKILFPPLPEMLYVQNISTKKCFQFKESRYFNCIIRPIIAKKNILHVLRWKTRCMNYRFLIFGQSQSGMGLTFAYNLSSYLCKLYNKSVQYQGRARVKYINSLQIIDRRKKSQTGGSTQMANKNNVSFAPIIHENTQTHSRQVVKINIFTILAAAGYFTISTPYANAQTGSYFVSSKHSTVALHTQKAHNNKYKLLIKHDRRADENCFVVSSYTQTSIEN